MPYHFKIVPPFLLLVTMILHACNTPGPGLFDKKSPHETYSRRITDAGLAGTMLGRSWFFAAEQSLGNAINISLPYSETGYYAAEKPQASGWQFPGKRGEKLHIHLNKKPASGFLVYMDLWEPGPGNARPKLLAAADTIGSLLEFEVKTDGLYILRLQPELLQSGEYTLTISSGPSLAFPIPEKAKATIGSFWGAGRDRGVRKHEGIDIFVPFRTPVVASANGVIDRVNENTLGGKVIFLRPESRNYSLYYAHLDTQLVQEGDPVRIGDTLGLVGNTGNARFTASHLHFGIYAPGGAIDPLPFVNRVTKKAGVISATLSNLGKTVRSSTKTKLYNQPGIKTMPSTQLEDNTLLLVEAATGSLYKVALPNGVTGYVSSADVSTLEKPLHKTVIRYSLPLLNKPDTSAPRKIILAKGEPVNILARFQNFYFVSNKDKQTGWIEKFNP